MIFVEILNFNSEITTVKITTFWNSTCIMKNMKKKEENDSVKTKQKHQEKKLNKTFVKFSNTLNVISISLSEKTFSPVSVILFSFSTSRQRLGWSFISTRVGSCIYHLYLHMIVWLALWPMISWHWPLVLGFLAHVQVIPWLSWKYLFYEFNFVVWHDSYR